MSNIYEQVIMQTKKIETLLEQNFGASGRGLHEKTSSVESTLREDITKKLRYIASVRNKLMHEDGYSLSDTDNFTSQCENVVEYLTINKAKRTRFNSKSQNNYACPHCSSTSNPRLYIERPTFIRTEKKRHICVHCGKDMYFTGGVIRHFIVIILYIALLMMMSSFIQHNIKEELSSIVMLISIVILVAIVSFHYKKTTDATPFFQVLLGLFIFISLTGIFFIFSYHQKPLKITDIVEISSTIAITVFMLYWYFKHKDN